MVENHPRTRSRNNFEVIPSVNTIGSVGNVVVDDEGEIEQEDEKSDDMDESDNERKESDGGADHKDDGGKEENELDVGEEDKADGGKDGDKVDLVEDDKADSEMDGDEVDAVEEKKVDGEKDGDHSEVISHENVDSVNKVEKSDEGPCDHDENGNGEETTLREATTIELWISNYPWGRKSIEVLVDVLQKDMKQPVLNKKNGKREYNYNFLGFSYVFMCWIYEVILSIR
ncbi:hypothetical protein K7X08_016746 [Anisodus acutangulus]|uniref:Uncharacterized protein n=1 Tax=Anisodus acutangulus TaxID=402998 RepID=A0A9Q1R676_9SOLA|nr:hypothetical protein K7X08_016746 [Anisodus acutangulus]